MDAERHQSRRSRILRHRRQSARSRPSSPSPNSLQSGHPAQAQRRDAGTMFTRLTTLLAEPRFDVLLAAREPSVRRPLLATSPRTARSTQPYTARAKRMRLDVEGAKAPTAVLPKLILPFVWRASWLHRKSSRMIRNRCRLACLVASFFRCSGQPRLPLLPPAYSAQPQAESLESRRTRRHDSSMWAPIRHQTFRPEEPIPAPLSASMCSGWIRAMVG